MSSPKVAIIIVNWNNLKDTMECLDSFKKVTYSNYEILLVDNASRGDDAIVLKENYEDFITVITNKKNYGFAEGCNIGIREALARGAKYVTLLNNDTVVSPDFLQPVIEALESNNDVGIAGGKVYCYENPEMIWFAGGLLDYETGETPIYGSGTVDSGLFNEMKEVGWICGCYMVITREVLEKVGMLDKRFFFGWEDVDICLRAIQQGYKILFVPDSKISHKALPPEKQKRLTGRPVYYATRGRFIFLEKHFNKRQLIVLGVRFILIFPKYIWHYSRILGEWKVIFYVLGGMWGYLLRKPREWVK